MTKIKAFFIDYALYRRSLHSRWYSATIAYGCAFRGLPF